MKNNPFNYSKHTSWNRDLASHKEVFMRTIKLGLLAVGIICLLTGIAFAQTDANEPNDTISAATTIQVDTDTLTGFLESASDTDFFKFTADSGERVVVTVEHQSGSSPFMLSAYYIFNYPGNQRIGKYDAVPGEMTVNIWGGDYYYFAVRPEGNNPVLGAYKVYVRKVAPQSVAITAPTNGQIVNGNTLTISWNVAIECSLSLTYTILDPVLQRFGRREEHRGSIGKAHSTDGSFQWTLPTLQSIDSTMEIRVVEKGAVFGRYAISDPFVIVPALLDANEPNDSNSMATPIQIGDTLNGIFPDLPPTDKDIFVFNSNAAQKVLIKAQSLSGGSTPTILYGSFGGPGEYIGEVALNMQEGRSYYFSIKRDKGRYRVWAEPLPMQTITITSPVRKATFRSEKDTCTVTWTTDLAGEVRVRLVAPVLDSAGRRRNFYLYASDAIAASSGSISFPVSILQTTNPAAYVTITEVAVGHPNPIFATVDSITITQDNPDANEPNNKPSQATLLQVDGPAIAGIKMRFYDPDYFKLQGKKGDRVLVRMESADTDPVVTMWEKVTHFWSDGYKAVPVGMATNRRYTVRAIGLTRTRIAHQESSTEVSIFTEGNLTDKSLTFTNSPIPDTFSAYQVLASVTMNPGAEISSKKKAAELAFSYGTTNIGGVYEKTMRIFRLDPSSGRLLPVDSNGVPKQLSFMYTFYSNRTGSVVDTNAKTVTCPIVDLSTYAILALRKSSGITERGLASHKPSFSLRALSTTRGRVGITVGLARAGGFTLSVFDVNGRRMMRQVRQNASVGYHHIQWNAAASGRIRQGIYFISLEQAGRRIGQKLVVVR